ncbi:retrovirus-related pol polyprotein from transposon TNT 1-94 [Tanacetum coccineum]
MKGKYVDTKFEKPSVVRQPNAFRFQKPPSSGLWLRWSLGQELIAWGRVLGEGSGWHQKMHGARGNDLLTGTRGSDLYTISLQESSSPTLICFMAKASPTQAWLWHHRISYLNFDIINLLSKNDIVNDLPKLKYAKDHLCSSCKLGKAKRSTFKTKTVPSSKELSYSQTPSHLWLHLLLSQRW